MYTQPQNIYLTVGAGIADYSLMAFDHALINAGIGDYNHIRVSSILPPGAKIHVVAPDVIARLLPSGTLTPTVWAENRGFGAETVAAAISIAVPSAPDVNGMIYEEHSAGTAEQAQENTERMAQEGMDIRDHAIDRIVSISWELQIPYNKFGCVLAAAVML